MVRHIRLVSFVVYFALLFSCTVHVRSLVIFMLIPVFVILLFSVTVFQPSFGGINFYGRNQLKACATLLPKIDPRFTVAKDYSVFLVLIG